MERNQVSKSLVFKAALVFLTFIALVFLAFMLTGKSTLFFGASREASQNYQEQLTSEIQGADLNQNGIRDDVDKWIVERFDETSPDRKAFLQLAADYQSVLLTTGDLQRSMSNLLTLSESLGCVRYVLKTDAEEEIARFKAVVLDTDIRVRAWLKAYERLEESGVGAESTPSASSCRFSM